MVLPAAPPHGEPAPPGWLERVALSLRLARRGLLVRVDAPDDAHLGRLVRHLLPEHPALAVRVGADALRSLPAESVCVLRVEADDAPALNLLRPIVAERDLRVVLWCDPASSEALRRFAPDFNDWISHTVECPERVPPFFKATIALAEHAPGFIAEGPGARRFGEALAEVAGSRPVPLDVSAPYAELLRVLSRSRSSGIWFEASALPSALELYSLRWALAAAGGGIRVVLPHGSRSAGWWRLRPAATPLSSSLFRLPRGLRGHELRLCALGDLEMPALHLISRLLEEGVSQAEIADRLMTGDDPGAELASFCWERRPAELARHLHREAGVDAPWARACLTRSGLREAFERERRHLAERLSAGPRLTPGEAAWWSAQPQSVCHTAQGQVAESAWWTLIEATRRVAGRAERVRRPSDSDPAIWWEREEYRHVRDQLEPVFARRADDLAPPSRAALARAAIALEDLQLARRVVEGADSPDVTLARVELDLRLGLHGRARGELGELAPMDRRHGVAGLRADTLRLRLAFELGDGALGRDVARRLQRHLRGGVSSYDEAWALVWWAATVARRGENAEAHAALDRVSGWLALAWPRRPRLEGWCELVRATVFMRHGAYTPATRSSARAAHLLSRKLGPSHPETLLARVQLALARRARGGARPGDAAVRKALGALAEALGDAHPVVRQYRDLAGE